MKLTLLLIPLILLSSCTIDWNDEKDAKIAVLEKQITELKEKNDDGLFKKNKECFQMKE
jgi:cytochrome c-type biogenesis protein CcmH/NrfG